MALFISSQAYADMERLEKHELEDNRYRDLDLITYCVDGYKFIYINDFLTNPGRAIATSIVQFYIEKNGSAVPAKC
tara:strand:- start:36 stop:263 length:228 start_codon:yes stop_codon:yes gene_type:complete